MICLLIPVIFLLGCSSNKVGSSKETRVNRLRVSMSFPTLKASGEFFVVKDSQYADYYKDLVIWRFPYKKEFQNNVFDTAGNLIKSELVRVKPEMQTFVYRKGQPEGSYYDSLEDRTAVFFPADSFLRDRLAFNDALLLSPYDSLLQSSKEKDGSVHMVYLRTRKTSKWDCDTSHLYFSGNMTAIDFSISHRLNSTYHSKLFRVWQISNGNTAVENPFFRRRREVFFEMSLSEVILSAEEKRYYEWLEGEIPLRE